MSNYVNQAKKRFDPGRGPILHPHLDRQSGLENSFTVGEINKKYLMRPRPWPIPPPFRSFKPGLDSLSEGATINPCRKVYPNRIVIERLLKSNYPIK